MVPKPTWRQLLRILCILQSYCGSSTSCHVPLEAVAQKLPREKRDLAPKALRRLVAMGLAWEKSHGPGRRSYGLTREGAGLAKQLCGGEEDYSGSAP